MMIKQGTRWVGSDRSKKFVVLADEVYLDDGIWIHYREVTNREDPREYSCYKASFLARFDLDADQG